MTSTRYVLTSEPYGKLTDYVQAAIAAITAIAGRPLESLDGIPENLRYLFREEVAVPADHEATLSAMGRFLTEGADDGCFDSDGLFSAICRGEVPGLPSPHEFAKVKAERDTFRELRDHDTETFATLNKVLDNLGIVVHDTYGEAIKAEVERLIADLSAQSNLANSAGKTIDQLKGEIDQLENFCEQGVASNDRLMQVIDQRDALKSEVEERIRERDHYAEQNDRWIAEVKQLKAEVAALRLKCGEF
jgi:hypothetical protein